MLTASMYGIDRRKRQIGITFPDRRNLNRAGSYATPARRDDSEIVGMGYSPVWIDDSGSSSGSSDSGSSCGGSD